MGSFRGVGARAMGMGGAYVAVSDDFSALYWNPAGLAQIRRNEIYTSIARHQGSTEALYFDSPASDEISNTRLGALGAVFPYPVYRGSLVFAGGFLRPKNFDTTLKIAGYDRGTQFHRSGSAQDEGALGVYSLGFAVDVSPSTSLGLALNIWDGAHVFSQQLTLEDPYDAHGDTVRLYQRFAFSDDYDGISLKGGALIRAEKGLRFGVVVSTPVTYKISSKYEDEFEDTFEDRVETYPTEQFRDQYKIRLPFQFGAGVSWTLLNGTLAADFHYLEWKQTEYKDLPEEIVPRVYSFEEQYQNVLRWHVGGEFRIPFLDVTARAGFYRDPLPFVGPIDPGEPVIQIEDDRAFFTFGAGALIDHVLHVDFALVRGRSKQVEGSRRDKTTTTQVFASAAYHF